MNTSRSITYSILREFTRVPGGRYRKHGPKSGEEFREDVLLPLIKQYEFIVVDMTGTAGYGASFLDESFGELGKILGLAEMKRRFKFIADDDPYIISVVWEKIQKGSMERNE